MADINHVISLGIGSPAAIPQFILFGLSPLAVVPAINRPVNFVSYTDPQTFESWSTLTHFESYTSRFDFLSWGSS